MQKDYEEPVFQLIKMDEENDVFYAASGGGGGGGGPLSVGAVSLPAVGDGGNSTWSSI